MNSLQENQRLSRLIQVREGKLQELKGQPQNLQNILQGKNHSQAQDLSENLGQNINKLDEILLKSQTNLQILCSKLGKIPKNIENAMNIVPVQPKSLTTSEKLECLEVFEMLKEKLTTISLDSEEILGYFKDIVLESEANAVNMNSDKELLMKLVDKRVEIFQSSDITRTKIQEAFHLAMKLEN